MIERVTPYAKYAAMIGLVCLVICLASLLVVGQPKTWIEVTGSVGLVLLAVSVLLRPEETKAVLTGRQARHGGNAVLMSVAFFAIVGLLNYLGARHHQRWDLTEGKQFSLSEQSVQILDSLTEPVQVKLFFTPGHYNRLKAEDMIKEYAVRTNKLTYEFIDPDAQRRLALEYQIGRDGTIVFERGDRREITFGVGEQDLTSALLKATRDEVKGVYFLTGHQERDPENAQQNGYSTLKQVLLSENYKVDSFNFAVTDTVPSDMAVLVVAGPAKPLSPEETARLGRFVEDGGSLLILVDPGLPDPFGGLLHNYGIEVADDFIVDPGRSFFGDVSSPLVDHYGFHQITKDLAGLSTFFPTARSITKGDPLPEEWNVQYLATSSTSSWAEVSYQQKRVQRDEDEAEGPLGLSAVIEPKTPGTGKGRLVVVGDAGFVENSILNSVRGSVGNVDFFMNAVSWLAEEEDLISIRPKPPEQRQVVLTPPQARGIIYSSIIFVPALVLIAGVVVWWRRR